MRNIKRKEERNKISNWFYSNECVHKLPLRSFHSFSIFIFRNQFCIAFCLFAFWLVFLLWIHMNLHAIQFSFGNCIPKGPIKTCIHWVSFAVLILVFFHFFFFFFLISFFSCGSAFTCYLTFRRSWPWKISIQWPKRSTRWK